MVSDESRLIILKIIHTMVWAIFAAAIFLIPICAFFKEVRFAWGLIGFVLLEVIVLFANSMHCPLTSIASRYTSDRQDNFDIYLPLWLARYNIIIFGGFYVIGIIYTVLIQVSMLFGA